MEKFTSWSPLGWKAQKKKTTNTMKVNNLLEAQMHGNLKTKSWDV